MTDRIEDGGPAEAGLVERLRERAVAAREESTATALGDALHFEDAARAIEYARSLVPELRAVAVRQKAQLDEAEHDTLAAESELRLVRKERDEAEAMVAKLTDQLMAAATEASSYRDACKSAGICMTCVLGAPDTFGCTDCLNTGFDGGQPVTCSGYTAGLETAAEAANGIEPGLLKGMSERYVSIYCTARVDAADAINALLTKPAERRYTEAEINTAIQSYFAPWFKNLDSRHEAHLLGVLRDLAADMKDIRPDPSRARQMGVQTGRAAHG